MRNRKLIFTLIVMMVILVVAAFVLAPSTAKAQGLVEYGLCLLAAQDTGVAVAPEYVPDLETHFGIAPWPDDYGVIGTCIPKFTRSTNEFTKIQVCFSAYKDEDNSGSLSPFDTEQARTCESFKF